MRTHRRPRCALGHSQKRNCAALNRSWKAAQPQVL